MTEALALTVVAAGGVFLLALGGVALATPARARAFLSGFASSTVTHTIELLVRACLGAAMVHAAPALPASPLFMGFGAVLLVTTALLALVPWRAHRAFARATVPQALRFLPLIGLVSLGAGVGMLWAVCITLAT